MSLLAAAAGRFPFFPEVTSVQACATWQTVLPYLILLSAGSRWQNLHTHQLQMLRTGTLRVFSDFSPSTTDPLVRRCRLLFSPENGERQPRFRRAEAHKHAPLRPVLVGKKPSVANVFNYRSLALPDNLTALPACLPSSQKLPMNLTTPSLRPVPFSVLLVGGSPC